MSPVERSHEEEGRKEEVYGDVLAKESLSKLGDIAPEDSDAYEHASRATETFVARTLGAASFLQKELEKDDALPPDHVDRLAEGERRQYEEFITQAEADAIILPLMLQQARVVQYQPDVQTRLKEVFDAVLGREDLIAAMERARAVMLKASERGGRRLSSDEIAEFGKFATISWMLRQKLSVRRDLSPEQTKALERQWEALRQAEGAYEKKTDKIGEEFGETRATGEKERRKAGAERITQGFPGAELVLDTPELSMKVWERLLIEGGPKERERAAKQLQESLSKFREDFLEKGAMEDYLDEARAGLRSVLLKNAFIREWFEFLKMDKVGEVATTDPEAFEKLFAQVEAKLRTQFDLIATPQNDATVKELADMLDSIASGRETDGDRLRTLLSSYAGIQRQTGVVLSDMQRWQVAQNAERPDNLMRGEGNMLEHLTRVGDKTAIGVLREQSPYGVFRTRSFIDPRTGRLVLLGPAPTPQELGLKGNAVEAGKLFLTVEAAMLVPILHRMAMRVPLAGRIFRPWYVRLGVPVAMAELSIAAVKEAASSLRMTQAADAVEGSIKQLESWSAEGVSPPARRLKREADQLFEHILILMQTGQGEHPGTPDQTLALEAHIYTNQILTALGFPPHHEISPTIVPGATDASMSPEVRDYVTVLATDRRGVDMHTRTALAQLRDTAGREADALAGKPASKERVKEDPVTVLLREKNIPSRMSDKGKLARLLAQASQAPEFRAPGSAYEKTLQALGETDVDRVEAAFRLAGDTRRALRTLHQLEQRYKKREAIPAKEREAIEQEIERLVGEDPMKLLTVARYLEDHQPSNAQIAEYWYGEPYPGAIRRWFGGTDREIDKRYGEAGKRQGLGRVFLDDWTVLWDYRRLLKSR